VKLECSREQEVMAAITAARWPDRCDDELRRHVAGCEVCADLVEVLAPLAEERDAAWDGARVPPAAVVWWRAQFRARDEALRAATRPLTAVYALALVFFGALIGGTAVTMLPRLRAWGSAAVASIQPPATADLANLIAPLTGNAVALLALGSWLLLAPVIVWLAVRNDAAD
jgi:hypothetical protein